MTQAPTQPLQGPPFATVLVVIGALTLARILALALSRTDLGFDEAQYWAWGRHFDWGYYTKPGLLAWLIRGATEACGNGVFCIRLPAPLLHAASALLIYAAGRRLHGQATGAWAAIAYALMPGLSLSSTLMTTDVPLLFFWCVALLALVLHLERPRFATALLMGGAIGLGLNAKYAMIYFPACMVLLALVSRDARRGLATRHMLAAALLAIALILPNVLWNAEHGFATYRHVGDNIGGRGASFRIGPALEFLGAQFAVMGPVFFVAYLIALTPYGRISNRRGFALLVCLSLPILAGVTLQGFLSRANANWAATAFPGAAILASAYLVEHAKRRSMIATVAIGLAALVAVSAGGVLADRGFGWRPLDRSYAPVTGWAAYAEQVEAVARREGLTRLVVVGRPLTSSLLYELRDGGFEIRAFTRDGGFPEDQYQIDMPWHPGDAGPALLVSRYGAEGLGIDPSRLRQVGEAVSRNELLGPTTLLYRID